MEWLELQEDFELEAEDCYDWLTNEYGKISSGRVNVNLYNNIKVEAYGELINLNQIANIQVVDARQILIKPYDKSQIKDISKAIANLNLNANAQINVDTIRLLFPPLTEENRRTNVKKAKELFEQAKTKIRNIRQSVQNKFKKLDGISEDTIRYFEEQLNKTTKDSNAKLEAIFAKKEHELMSL